VGLARLQTANWSVTSQWSVSLQLANSWQRRHWKVKTVGCILTRLMGGQERTSIYYNWWKRLASLQPTREAKQQALVQLATYDKQLTSCSSACFILTASCASLPTLSYWRNIATMVWSVIVYWRQTGECNSAGCKPNFVTIAFEDSLNACVAQWAWFTSDISKRLLSAGKAELLAITKNHKQQPLIRSLAFKILWSGDPFVITVSCDHRSLSLHLET